MQEIQQTIGNKLETASETQAAKLVEQRGGVWRTHDGYFTDKGFLFHALPGQQPVYIEDLYGVESMLIYKGKLFLIDNDRDVYLFNENGSSSRERFFKLGNSAVKMVENGNDLYILTHSEGGILSSEYRSVAVYKGQPGEIRWQTVPIMIPINIPSGNTTITIYNTIYVEMPEGREIAFTDLNVPGSIDLIKSGSDVVAIRQDGTRVVVSRE